MTNTLLSNFQFDPNTNLIIIPTLIVGPHGDIVLRLALDTGASMSMISEDAFTLIGYDLMQTRNRIQITTGSGIENVPRLLIKSITALGITRYDHEAFCHNLPGTASIDGVLGLNFFYDLCLQIDFREGLITVS